MVYKYFYKFEKSIYVSFGRVFFTLCISTIEFQTVEELISSERRTFRKNNFRSFFPSACKYIHTCANIFPAKINKRTSDINKSMFYCAYLCRNKNRINIFTSRFIRDVATLRTNEKAWRAIRKMGIFPELPIIFSLGFYACVKLSIVRILLWSKSVKSLLT